MDDVHPKHVFIVKPQSSDLSMSTQHIGKLLGATCCVRLATDAMSWVLLAYV